MCVTGRGVSSFSLTQRSSPASERTEVAEVRREASVHVLHVLFAWAARSLTALVLVVAVAVAVAASTAHAFAVGPTYLSDCGPGEAPPQCGDPPAHWDTSRGAVTFCTFESGRPAGLTIDQFKQAIQAAAATWSNAGAAVTLSYTGDCSTGFAVRSDDGRNEIGFDTTGTVVTGTEAGVTQASTTWSPASNPTVRTITEADISLARSAATLPAACLQSLMLHEFGHALGLGHSTSTGDVMYPSLDPSRSTSCRTAPSAAEQSMLQGLYGVSVSSAPITGSATITSGSIPASGGFGLIVFGGGSNAQLVAAANCPLSTVSFWTSDGSGGYIAYIPGSSISAVNGAWSTRFPSGIPAGTPLIARCR